MTEFDGWEDFRGKVKLLRPQPNDVLVLIGVELPHDLDMPALVAMVRERVGVDDVKFITLASPDADATLERKP